MAAVVQTLRHNKWHDRYPELGTGPIPIEPYVSREYFEQERERIFRKVWLNIGRVEQIPQSGRLFCQRSRMCNTSILVVHGKDGAIRAFHNMCSHRGNQLVWNKQGDLSNVYLQIPRLGVCTRWFSAISPTKTTSLASRRSPGDDALHPPLRTLSSPPPPPSLPSSSLPPSLSPSPPLTPPSVSVDTWEGFISKMWTLILSRRYSSIRGRTAGKHHGVSLCGNISQLLFVAHRCQCQLEGCQRRVQEVYHISTPYRRIIGNVFAVKQIPMRTRSILRSFLRTAGFRCRPILIGSHPVESLAQRFGSVVLQQNNIYSKKLPKGVNPTRYTIGRSTVLPCFRTVLSTFPTGRMTQIFGRWRKTGRAGKSGPIRRRQKRWRSDSARKSARSRFVTRCWKMAALWRGPKDVGVRSEEGNRSTR